MDDEVLLTLELVIGRVKYGTPIAIIDEATSREEYYGIHDFSRRLPENLLEAEVSMLSIKDGVLCIAVLYEDEI